MPSIHRLSRIATLVIVLALATACGGGGGSGSGQTGSFVDSPVGGLRYIGPLFSGTTDALGQYQYVPGDQVCFFLGFIPFGCVEARGLVCPIDLFPDSDTSDDRVLNVVRFLMSLDLDGDPSNGIDVSHITTVALDAGIDFDQPGDDFGNDPLVLAFIDAQGFDGSLVDAEAAALHLSESLDNILYFEQELHGNWMYTRYTEAVASQATTVSIDEQEVLDTQADVSEEGDVSFVLAGELAGESCFHDGVFEGDDLILGSVDCFFPREVLVAALALDGFRMDRLDGSGYETAQLFGNWFVVSPFAENLLVFDAENLADFAGSLSASGSVHFETVEDLEAEGEACVYQGQMNAGRNFVSGSVECSVSGAGAFTMEAELDEI